MGLLWPTPTEVVRPIPTVPALPVVSRGSRERRAKPPRDDDRAERRVLLLGLVLHQLQAYDPEELQRISNIILCPAFETLTQRELAAEVVYQYVQTGEDRYYDILYK